MLYLDGGYHMKMQHGERDYSITGPERNHAIEKGLASANWYQCQIPRKRLKELTTRRDGPPIRDFFIWLLLLMWSGYLAYLSWGTWWTILTFLIYGSIYTIPAVTKCHESGHGTPFRTPWMNEFL
jgi:fatty acid desaturase